MRNITIVMTPVGGLGTPIVLAEGVDAAVGEAGSRALLGALGR